MFSLSFSTSNAAFQEDEDYPPLFECAVILDQIASRLRYAHTSGRVRDTNGNTIGEWSLTPND